MNRWWLTITRQLPVWSWNQWVGRRGPAQSGHLDMNQMTLSASLCGGIPWVKTNAPTATVEQLQLVMNPIVGLFSRRLLNTTKQTEDAFGFGTAVRQAIAVKRVWFVPRHLPALSHLLFFHKVHIGGALDLYRLSLPVVQRQHKVEEVGLPQVGRRLLLKVSASQTHPAGRWTGWRVQGRQTQRPFHLSWKIIQWWLLNE